MKFKLLFALLFTCSTLMLNAQVVFDPATYDVANLSAGMEIVDIEGTSYLQVVLDGYNATLDLEELDLVPGQSVVYTTKYALGAATADSLTAADVQSIIQILDTLNQIPAPWDAASMISARTTLTKNPFNSEFVTDTLAIISQMENVHQFQIYGQETSAYGATTGDTIWVGKIVIIPETMVTNEFPIENVVVGSVDDAQDFSAVVNLIWDMDSIYMEFVVTDDSIVSAGGNNYQVDNIEVYLDMDNSKNIKYPRNGGWMQDDPTYDANDYQFRLIPDSAFNSAFAGNTLKGVRQVYTVNDTGYVFNLHIDLDSLLLGFIPAVDTVIGFDVLISDNDDADDVGDASRNQITMNSPTDKPFNDPSLFATLKLKEAGKFKLIPDLLKPSAVQNFAAAPSDSTVTLTWDTAEDNIAVMLYNIYQDGVSIGTVYGKETGNSKKVTPLEPGNYTFSIEAVDNYGNVSGKANATAEVVLVENAINSTTASVKVYPNPANSILNILDVQDIQEVSIISITGSVVITTNTNRIDVAGLKQGMYLVRIKAADGIYSTTFVKE